MLRAGAAKVLQNLDQLKGKRLDPIEAVLRAVIRSESDWVHTVAMAGGVDGMDMAYMMKWYQKADGSGEFRLIIKDPVSFLGSHFGFRYLTDVSFPIAVLCYLSAQTLKALKGESQHIVLSVLSIVAFWLFFMAKDLLSLYRKIRD